jgi:hypothetical protein
MDETASADQSTRAMGGPVAGPESFLLPPGEPLVRVGSSAEVGSRAWFERLAIGRHPGTMHLMRYFAWMHLPESLRQVSAPFGYLAETLLVLLPDGPELTAALRKLVESKDCATRAMVDKLAAE